MPSPKPRRRAASRPAPRRARLYNEQHIAGFLIVICLLQTAFLGTLLYLLINLRIPDLSSVTRYQPSQATLIHDRHGRVVERIFVENRRVVPLKQMSPYLGKAFVAAEDGRFYDHPGLDFFSVMRALVNNFRAGAKSQGGSTITQQVAKSLLLSPEKTYVRKFKEAILAWRIDRLLSKEEILYIYLNQIYLGEGAYGVEAAAQVYFNKSAAKLTLAESALLAGLPQAPSRYALFSYLDRAVARQKYVLNRMAADGHITAQAARQAFAEKIVLAKRRGETGGDNGYYLEVVKRQARALLNKPLQSAGVSIYTALDPGMQEKAAVAVRRGVQAWQARQAVSGKTAKAGPQGALVCIETASARVRALTGGTSFSVTPFDRATQARRQAGSTFKPFLYAVALEQGWQPQSAIDDSPITVRGRGGKPWQPKNYGNSYHGMTTLADALAHSLNGATVRLMQSTGYRGVHALARRAGISAELPPDLSLSLGAVDISLLELTGAYTPFAGNGRYRRPQFIEKIVSEGGAEIPLETGQQAQTVAGDKVIRDMQFMLKGVVNRGSGKVVADVPGVRGGKTGTSDENRDAWFVGYDQQYTTGVWVGNDQNHSLGSRESGGSAAAPIWRDFMLAVRRH